MDFHVRDWPELAVTTVIGGLVAGLVMGAILQAGTNVLATIGQVSGSPSPLVGWVVHLLLSIVFAGVFIVTLATKPIEVGFQEPLDVVLLAIGYGALLATVTWGFVIPVSLGFEEVFPLGLTPSAAAVARFSIVLGIAHMSYGLVLGAIIVYRHRPLPLFEESVEG